MKFSQWLENRVILEGKGKRQPQSVNAPKEKLDLKKGIKIQLDLKKPWEVSKGHTSHLSGAGSHDNRPKRSRTRNDANRKAIRDYD